MGGDQIMRERIELANWLRMSMFVALLVAGFAIVYFTSIGEFLTEARMASLITELRNVWWSPMLLIGLYTVMGALGLPTGPLLVGGAVFGAFYGTIYNVLGLVIGAMLGYQVANLLGRKFVVRVAGQRLKRAEGILERRGFWPLVQTRFMPIPFPVINFGAALAGVRPPLFLSATLVGLIPSTLIHTYFIAELFVTHGSERAMTLVWYAGAFVLFNVLISILWLREKPAQMRSASKWFASHIRLLIYRLDRILRWKMGIYEYWEDPECLFRVSVTHTSRPIRVSGGEVPAGAKVLEMHFWNENFPHVPPDGPDMAFAVNLHRMGTSSLRALADHIKKDSRLAEVQAVGGVTSLFGAGEGSAEERAFSKNGFTITSHHNSLGFFGRFWESVYAWMIMWAFNPATLQHKSLLQLPWSEFWMFADDFVGRYASTQVQSSKVYGSRLKNDEHRPV